MLRYLHEDLPIDDEPHDPPLHHAGAGRVAPCRSRSRNHGGGAESAASDRCIDDARETDSIEEKFMIQVHVTKTEYGFLPTLHWNDGSSMDREAYDTTFDTLEDAERVGRGWASDQGAQYVPYVPVDEEAIRRKCVLVREIREADGVDLRTAIARAEAMLADGKK
jgi:hypothetical protein